jgi:CRP-like cAMP-binding protein
MDAVANLGAVAKPCGNRLLDALSDRALALLGADLKSVPLPQGAICFQAGDPIEQVYFPQTGMISLLLTTGEGEVVETSSIGCEGAAGIQCGLGHRQSFTRAIVQISGNFSTISAARFEQAVNQSAVLRDMVCRYTEVLWAEAQQIAACNAIHDGSSRLCRWLLQSADRIGSERLPLTQEFLAEMLGVRRTTVTLLAQELQKRGVLKYSRGKINILDRPALEACACECYEATKHHKLSSKLGVKL